MRKLLTPLVAISLAANAAPSPTPPDLSPHTIRFVTVDKDVNLEVLDWGGSGRSVVLLAGLGNTAHVYDQFAPKLTPKYHVYGITRRGFGNSSTPLTGYSADRLGDDVLAVLDALHLDRPILVGHSIAGEELSSVGSRYPQRVAGLVYLDAGYAYAYYDPAGSAAYVVDSAELERKLHQLVVGGIPDVGAFVRGLLDTDLPRFEQTLQASQRKPFTAPPAAQSAAPPPQLPPVLQDILEGQQRYTSIPVPILAIWPVPHEIPPAPGEDPAEHAAAEVRDEAINGAQADAFEKGLPTAHVVRLSHANHYVFRSNEADVIREMDAFIRKLPH